MKTEHVILNMDVREYLDFDETYDMAFADPPDNIGLKYDGYEDSLPDADYSELIYKTIEAGLSGKWFWLSFGAKHFRRVCFALDRVEGDYGINIPVKHCVQTYTFGQHNRNDLGNNHRPLWRLRGADDASLYPNAIRIKSERQKSGDKRADPRGRVPGDVFDFPRVVGNAKQRRSWSPTQLHEGLVERCMLLTTKPGDRVLDLFAGTGTVLRVAKRLGRNSVSIDISRECCENIAKEHGLVVE